MYRIFCDLNPPEKIRDRFGIVAAFSKFFKAKFPHYNDEVVKLAARMFMFIRLRTVNDKALKNMIRNSAKNPKTKRGAMKRVDQSF